MAFFSRALKQMGWRNGLSQHICLLQRGKVYVCICFGEFTLVSCVVYEHLKGHWGNPLSLTITLGFLNQGLQ